MSRVTTSNGRLFLDGKPTALGGVNLYNRNNAQKVVDLFPRASLVRCSTESIAALNDANHWDSVIGPATQAGKLCMIEMHDWVTRADGGQGPPDAYSGAQLQQVAAGYKVQGQKWKANELVIFESPNEPQYGDLTAEHKGVHDALRSVSEALLFFQGGRGGGNPGAVGAAVLNVDWYKATKNTGMSLHSYGWASGNSTDQGKVTDTLMGNPRDSGILALQAMTNSAGKMAVLMSESGCSTNSQSRDVNWQQVMTAIVNAVLNGNLVGAAFWDWDADAINAMVQAQGANYSRTDWGNTVAAQFDKIAAYAVTLAGTGGTGGTTTPSKPASGGTTTPATPATGSNAVIMLTPGDNKSFRDSKGATWTLPANGDATRGGKAVNGGGGTGTLAFDPASNTIYRLDAATKAWFTFSDPDWSPAANGPGSTRATSADNTLVDASGTIVDSAGDAWSIQSGQVAVNGKPDPTTANVTALAYQGGKVWQQNASKLWWGKAKAADVWAPAAGQAASPVTASQPSKPAGGTTDAATKQAAIAALTLALTDIDTARAQVVATLAAVKQL